MMSDLLPTRMPVDGRLVRSFCLFRPRGAGLRQGSSYAREVDYEDPHTEHPKVPDCLAEQAHGDHTTTNTIKALKAMRAALHVLQIFAFVSRSGAFAPVAFPSQCLPRRISPVRKLRMMEPVNDAAQKALKQAAQLRQEAADLENELAKGT